MHSRQFPERIARVGKAVLARALVVCVALALAGPATGLAQPNDPVRLGVFAYRPAQIMQARFDPLAAYLTRRLGVPVELQVLGQEAMEQALRERRLDFFLTNPSHFLMIRSELRISGVLATLVRQEDGVATSWLGGVIVADAERDDITTLQDVAGRTIATPGVHFLGGFQAQALVLKQAGIDVRRRNRMKLVGSHDRVIRAVLSGDAEVGFVRTGILEQLAVREPDLLDRLRVLNPQQVPEFPYLLSTGLYPEWPLAALPHVSAERVRRVAAALFAIAPDSAAARAMGIAGFSPPADYQPVDQLARSLRLPPYDQIPEVTGQEVLHQYRIWVATAVFLLILLIGTSLWLAKQTRALTLEQRRARRFVENWPQPMLMLRSGVFAQVNRSAADLLRYPSRRSLLGKDLAAFSPDHQPDGAISRQKAEQLLRRVSGGEVQQLEWVFRRSDGSEVWVDMTLAPVHEPGDPDPFVLCSWYDITHRIEAEQQQRMAASVFEHAREAIFITDHHGMVIDVNDAYVAITGRPRDRAIGRLPPLPLEEGSGVFASARAKGFWSGEFFSKREDGERCALALTVSAVSDNHDDVTHFVGVFSDISRLKQQEEELRAMAHYDALTGLPNRVLFADRLQQTMAQARRQDFRLAVIYIDLDEFKPVNDAHGHEAGDQLLIEIANRMRSVLREEDTVARLGGDEFAALIVNVESEAVLGMLLSRLLHVVAEPVWVAGHQVRVSASIGSTMYPQPQELDGDQLLRQADQAMYRAKQLGRNRYQPFDPSES